MRGVRWAGGGRDGEWWELFTSIKTACFKREPTSLSSRDRERGREGAGGSGEGGREGGREPEGGREGRGGEPGDDLKPWGRREGGRGGEVSLGMI